MDLARINALVLLLYIYSVRGGMQCLRHHVVEAMLTGVLVELVEVVVEARLHSWRWLALA